MDFIGRGEFLFYVFDLLLPKDGARVGFLARPPTHDSPAVICKLGILSLLAYWALLSTYLGNIGYVIVLKVLSEALILQRLLFCFFN